MIKMKLEKKLIDTLGTWDTFRMSMVVDGKKVGYADVMIDRDDSDEAYIEWIEIDEEFRGQGLGTKTLNLLAETYGFIYFAPTDEDNQRLYERIAEEYGANAPEVDQGFGVYYMEG